MVINMIVNIYSTEVCPKCQKLKKFLEANGVKFDVLNMQDSENLTELRFNQVFTNNAPVLQIETRFYTVEQLFNGTELNNELILNSIKVV